MPIDTAQPLNEGKRLWRVVPKEPVSSYPGLRLDVPLSRNRDMGWVRQLEKKSADRRIGVWLRLEDTPQGLALTMTDETGITARAQADLPKKDAARDTAKGEAALREHLGKLGATIYTAHEVVLATRQAWFVPPGVLNALRREAVERLDAARLASHVRLPRQPERQPPAPYPEDTLTYLANVYNAKARDFYARHGVKVIGAAYESHEALGEASLMITKHCVRFSMSLCPKQAKGVTGVQGTVRAEPLTIQNGDEVLTLKFDCKPCEMHVVGRMKKNVLNRTAREEKASLATAAPIQFYRTRPAATAR